MKMLDGKSKRDEFLPTRINECERVCVNTIMLKNNNECQKRKIALQHTLEDTWCVCVGQRDRETERKGKNGSARGREKREIYRAIPIGDLIPHDSSCHSFNSHTNTYTLAPTMPIHWLTKPLYSTFTRCYRTKTNKNATK